MMIKQRCCETQVFSSQGVSYFLLLSTLFLFSLLLLWPECRLENITQLLALSCKLFVQIQEH